MLLNIVTVCGGGEEREGEGAVWWKHNRGAATNAVVPIDSMRHHGQKRLVRYLWCVAWCPDVVLTFHLNEFELQFHHLCAPTFV